MKAVWTSHRLVAICMLLFLPCSGCGPSTAPQVPPAPLWCPPPLTWTEGEPRPERLEITNQTDRALSVFLDECIGHVRLGFLPPRETTGFRLPRKLIPFNGQLHVHMGDPEARTQFGSFAVPVVMERSLSLTIDEDTPSVVKSYDPAAPPPKPMEGLEGFQTSPGEEISYASKWADGTAAVLTWVCHRGERRLTFSPVYTEADELPVGLRFDDGPDGDRVPWTVVHGRSDNLLASQPVVVSLTGRALGAETLRISVEEGHQEERHSFSLDGLDEALELLPCFRGIGRRSSGG